MPNALKQRIPDFSIIWEYYQRPAIPSTAIKRKKTTALPVKAPAKAIAHIATALTSQRKKRLMKNVGADPATLGTSSLGGAGRAYGREGEASAGGAGGHRRWWTTG